MTRSEREALKRLIDAERREREKINRQTKELVCRSCGIDYDADTKGCRTCISRRRNRLLRGYSVVRSCKGCGGNLNDLNPGCSTCRERSKARGFGRNGDYSPLENAA